MALARTRRGESGMNYWPGFVDALSTLILSIIFILTVFVVVQFYLQQEVAGKDTALTRLNAQIAAAHRTPVDGEDRQGRSGGPARAVAAQRSPPPQSDRDKYKGLADSAGAGAAAAQGKVTELTGQLEGEKKISANALAQVEILNQQIAALRRQLAAIEQALDASEKKDKEAQTQDRRSRPAAQSGAGAEGAGADQVPLRLLRQAARDPRQPARHAHRRRPLRAAIGGVLRHRQGRPQAGGAQRARQGRRRAHRTREADPGRHPLGAARRRPHRRAADHRRRSSSRTGTCRRRARSRWCNI